MNSPGEERTHSSDWLDDVRVAPSLRAELVEMLATRGIGLPDAGYDGSSANRDSGKLETALILLTILVAIVVLGLAIYFGANAAYVLADQVQIPIAIVHTAN